MNYEVVNLKEKVVAGIKIRTQNNDPSMTMSIGNAWKRFFSEGMYQAIINKQNDKSIGLYTNYESNVNGAYDMMVCCEVSNTASLPSGVNTHIIPTGRYAKFIIHGDVPKVVTEFWTKLWLMNLDRKYSSDFEEYQNGCEGNKAEIHIYISLN